MKQTAVEWLEKEIEFISIQVFDGFLTFIEFMEEREKLCKQAKEMEEKNLLEMIHKFGFDYTYNYKGEKTIYEWIPEWFEEYKRLEKFKNK